MKPYRMYVTTVDPGDKQEHSEGPYEFSTAGAAINWVKKQKSVEVVEVTIWCGDDLVAKVDMR